MLNYAGGNPITAYNLQRSMRFRASASAYLSRTPASAGNRQKFTQRYLCKRGSLSTLQRLATATNDALNVNWDQVFFNTSDQLEIWGYSGTSQYRLITSKVYRDPAGFYDLQVAFDTTQATASNRIRIYDNGVEITSFASATYPPLNYSTYFNLNSPHTIGYSASTFDGYLCDVYWVDGQQLTPSSFGSFNSTTGVWQPAKYTGTYGTNGFYLPFTDNSALTTTTNVGLGKDFSGNGNYWTTNNISITASVTYDSMTDVPTLTSASAANFAVLNPLDTGGVTLSNGNLSYAGSASNVLVRASIFPPLGKWYWEVQADVNSLIGTATSSQSNTTYPGQIPGSFGYYGNSGQIFVNTLPITTVAAYTTTDVIGFALDTNANTCAVYKNNVLQTTVTGLIDPVPAVGRQSSNGSVNFGQRPFTYTPPSGFVALNTYNLPDSTIKQGNKVMDATLYTGNLVGQVITNAAGFKPDLVWPKSRSAATDNKLVDSVRGATLALVSNSTAAETTDLTGVVSFNSNGFTLGTSTTYNNLAATYVAWQWQAGQGTTSTNTNGTITSTVSVNPTAGFSVVTYTGTGANATVGHGLGVAPAMIIIKNRTGANGWVVYHAYDNASPASGYMRLDATNAFATDATAFNNTTPTSSVFSIGNLGGVNTSTNNYVAYCFAPIAGYSAFGSISANGSADNYFAYTGFLPRFVMLKRTDSTSNWIIWDTARNTYNVLGAELYPNLSNAESSAVDLDIVSNGFKLRSSGFSGTWIYAAFATTPFKNSLAF